MKDTGRNVIILLLGALLGAALMYRRNAVYHASGIVNPTAEKAGLETIHNIQRTLQAWYYDKEKLSVTGMWEGSIKGFVNSLQDPYTEYLPAEKNTDFNQALKWEDSFEGIGAAVQKKDDGIQIQEIYKGTPSAIAWLQPLDLVLEINGEKTADLSLADAVAKIRGPKDTIVKLLIYREREKDSTKRVFTVEVTRKKVDIPSVKSEVVNAWGGKNIGIIDISIIGEETEALLKQEIRSLAASGNVAGIILDLRGNGGGFLPKAVEIASHFIPLGKKVVTAKYTLFPDETYMSKGYGDFEKLPIVVLVDGLTASAGEIIAWALQQTRGAVLVGSQTFGKWSIQTVATVGSGSALKYTIGKRYLPDDTNINHVGIAPDVSVLFDKDAYIKDQIDAQKDRAILEMKKLLQ